MFDQGKLFGKILREIFWSSVLGSAVGESSLQIPSLNVVVAFLFLNENCLTKSLPN